MPLDQVEDLESEHLGGSLDGLPLSNLAFFGLQDGEEEEEESFSPPSKRKPQKNTSNATKRKRNDDKEDGEEEEEESFSPPSKRKPKKNTSQATKRKRNDDKADGCCISDDHQEAMPLEGAHAPRIDWEPFVNEIKDGEVRFHKNRLFRGKCTKATIKLCPGERVINIEMALRWKTLYSPFGSTRDRQWHYVRRIARDLQYGHGNRVKGPQDFVTFNYEDKGTKPLNKIGSFVELQTYAITFKLGVHNNALRANSSRQTCRPGELFLCLEVTIRNEKDKSQVLYRAFSHGFQAYPFKKNKTILWENVPKDREERILINHPSNLASGPSLAVGSPVKTQRRDLFDEASVQSFTGNLGWNRGGAVCVTFTGNPVPQEQLSGFKFGNYETVNFHWDNPYTVIFHPASLRSFFWDLITKDNADAKKMVARVKRFICTMPTTNGCLKLKLRFKNLDLDRECCVGIEIPFDYPLKGLGNGDDVWEKYGHKMLL